MNRSPEGGNRKTEASTAQKDEVARIAAELMEEPGTHARDKRIGSSTLAANTVGEAKKNSAFKKAVAATLLTGGVVLGGIAGYMANKPAQPTDATEETATDDDEMPGNIENQEEANPFAGEMPNGLRYNYAEYFGEKKSPNSFGGDYSELYGNVEATKQKHFERAFNDPEILASEVFFCFPEAIKDELGVKGLNPRQIEDAMDGENGGEMQKRTQEIFEKAVFDKETTINFHLANGPQKTIYSYCEDVNNDGVITPDEKHLEWDTKDRHDAKQFDITYAFHITGPDGQERVEYITVTYNMDCGDQQVVEIVPEGIEEHHDDDSSGSEPTGSEPTGSEPTAGNEGTEPDTADNEGTNPPSITPKDASNMTRIDNQIQTDIANDIGSEQVIVHLDSAGNQSITFQPSSNNQTAPDVSQNPSASAATPTQPSVSTNVVSENRAPANEQAQNVVPDTISQEQADSAKIEVVEPTDEELAAFGIN